MPPSGYMPRNGFYFDAICRQNPIDDRPDPEDNLQEFGPGEDDLRHYVRQPKSLEPVRAC